MGIIKYPIQNSEIVFKEEADDWAVLFDPNSGEIYGLEPISIFVWKKLDGKHSIERIVDELKKACDDVPANAEQDIIDFVNDLASKGFAAYESINS